MYTTPSEVEFETHTIGPLVLTTPFLRRLGLRETINRLCPVAQQADFDLGLVAELVVQSRLSDPRALYDMPQWATTYHIAELYDDMEDASNSMMTGLAACWMIFIPNGPWCGER